MFKMMKKKTLCSVLRGMAVGCSVGAAVGIGARLLCLNSSRRRLIRRAEHRAEKILLQLMK